MGPELFSSTANFTATCLHVNPNVDSLLLLSRFTSLFRRNLMSTRGKSPSRDFIYTDPVSQPARPLFARLIAPSLALPETESNHGNRYKGLICLGANDIIVETRCAMVRRTARVDANLYCNFVCCCELTQLLFL